MERAVDRGICVAIIIMWILQATTFVTIAEPKDKALLVSVPTLMVMKSGP